jgi:hypothetical protein
MLVRARVPNLLTEFGCVPGRVSANIEHDEPVDIRVPEKPCPREVRGGMDFDSMTPQDASARLAGSLAAIDKENFLAVANRSATKRWGAMHTTPLRLERPLVGRGDLEGFCARSVGESREIENALIRHRGLLFLRSSQ